MDTKFRLLKPYEINVMVKKVYNNKSAQVLFYKDARTDMTLLDETVGQANWKTEYHAINNSLYCTLSIWDEEKHEWIGKQSNGSESMMESEKGQASDALKRAGFLWGIGRELYTAPSTFIDVRPDEINDKNGLKPSVRFHVTNIGYNEKRHCITKVSISDQYGKPRYSWKSKDFETTIDITNDLESSTIDSETSSTPESPTTIVEPKPVEKPVEKKPEPKEEQKPAETLKADNKLPTDKVELVKMLEGIGCDIEKVLIAYKHNTFEEISVQELQQAYFRKMNSITRKARA